MPENNNNNTSGSKIPASTEGLSRRGSVSPEDLRKYNLIPSEDESTPGNSDSVVGKDVGTSSDFVNNVPSSNPNPIPAANQDENLDHLQASKTNDDQMNPSDLGSNNNDASEDAQKAPVATAARTDKEVNDEKPWENTFDSDTDESGHVSRAVSKGKQRGNHTLVAVLVIILIALMFIPVTLYFVRGGDNNSSMQNGQTEQSVEKQDKDTAKKSNAKKSTTTKKKSSSKKSASSSKKDTNNDDNLGTVNEDSDSSSQATNSDDSSQANSDTSAQQSQQASSSNDTSSQQSSASQNSGSQASYYTVKQGEGWYRAAVNSGMTTAQLKSLNPGVSTLSPGTQLRIK